MVTVEERDDASESIDMQDDTFEFSHNLESTLNRKVSQASPKLLIVRSEEYLALDLVRR